MRSCWNSWRPWKMLLLGNEQKSQQSKRRAQSSPVRPPACMCGLMRHRTIRGFVGSSLFTERLSLLKDKSSDKSVLNYLSLCEKDVSSSRGMLNNRFTHWIYYFCLSLLLLTSTSDTFSLASSFLSEAFSVLLHFTRLLWINSPFLLHPYSFSLRVHILTVSSLIRKDLLAFCVVGQCSLSPCTIEIKIIGIFQT